MVQVFTWTRGMALAGFMVVVTVLGSGGVAVAGGAGCHSQAISDGSGVAVTVAGFCFEPTVLRVDVGQTVTWTNEDSVPHMVTGANRAWGSTDQFARGGAVTERFEQAGVYPYWCPLHPSMLGTVVVGEDSGEATALDVGAGDGSSEAGWGAAGVAGGVVLMSVGMVAWRRRPSLMSRFG